jgi:hypothetical protein
MLWASGCHRLCWQRFYHVRIASHKPDLSKSAVQLYDLMSHSSTHRNPTPPSPRQWRAAITEEDQGNERIDRCRIKTQGTQSPENPPSSSPAIFDIFSGHVYLDKLVGGVSSLGFEAGVIDSFPSHPPVHHRPEHNPRAWPFQNPVTMLSIPKMRHSCSQISDMAYMSTTYAWPVSQNAMRAQHIKYWILKRLFDAAYLYRSDRSSERVESPIFS